MIADTRDLIKAEMDSTGHATGEPRIAREFGEKGQIVLIPHESGDVTVAIGGHQGIILEYGEQTHWDTWNKAESQPYEPTVWYITIEPGEIRDALKYVNDVANEALRREMASKEAVRKASLDNNHREE